MRTRRFLALAVLIFSGLFTADLASADSWDYVYGEDPTNANNVSGFTGVKADPLGGTFVAGYFFGVFEGMNSNGLWTKFVQHRNESGVVDWTYTYDSVAGSFPPEAPQMMLVDGEGTLFIDVRANNISGTNIASVSRSGSWTQGSITCGSYLADPSAGVLAICGNELKKFDASFNESWSVNAASRLGTQSPYMGGNANATLTLGSGGSFWVVANFNENNFSLDQSQLPLVYRTHLGLTRFSTTTGSEIVAVKHYGIVGFDAYAAGDRNLWVHTKSSSMAQERVSVFRSSNGERIGDVDSRFGLYGTNWNGTLSDLEALLRVSDQYGFGARDMSTPNICGYALFIGARWDFPRGPVCGSSTMGSTIDAQVVFTNDGRRVAMSNRNRLWVFEIDGEDLPKIGRLVMRKDFDATISSFDMDDFGNIYVVGKTFTSTVVAAAERRAQSSFTSSRGFIVRNPSGAMGLTVLPRTPLRFKVTGANGVPASGVGAVSMNVTVTSPDAEGFITVYPCDSRPDASNLNYVLNQTVPNAVIAPVSANGEVCFYTFAQTHLIADVNGYFPTGSGFVSNTPARVIDTRVGSAQGLRTVSKTKVGNGTELRVQFTNLPGGITPASGVGAVSLNVTVTGSQAPAAGGFVTVYPCGNRPDASNLNFRTGQTVPNAVITPVSGSGEVCFYVFGSTDVIADINGYFPSGSGFVATDPVRVADTRAGSAQGLRTVTKQRIGGNTTLQLQLTNLPGGITPASGIGAVSLNVTAVNTTANQYGGYVTTYPCGALPDVSSLNFVSNQIVPNAVIAPLSANGTICFYAYGETDLIVDLNGYFPTGAGFVPVSPKRMFDTR